MKKSLIFSLIIVAAISSCKKDDKSVFDKSPDERLKEKLDAYQAQLSGAQYGWKAIIKVDSGKGPTYGFYFKFNNENRVVMLSDFDSLSAVTQKESSYRLKALQQPSLIFDTYSYLHVLSDPDETISGGVRGAGLLSDFEFYFDSTTTDTIKLVGRLNGSKAVLIRATQQEATSYDNKELISGFLFKNIGKYLNYFKRVIIGGVTYEINVNLTNRTITFSWLDGSGALQTFTTNFYYSVTGIQFFTALNNGNQTITGFTNLNWNAASTTLSFSVNGAPTTVTGSGQPVKVDLGAPKRWWDYAVNNGNTYWFSVQGFHVNGVDDAFDIQSLTNGTSTYYYLFYWPGVTASNDAFGLFFLNAAGTDLDLPYVTAPTPSFTSDGRAIFIRLGDYGPPNFLPYPTTGPVAQSTTLLYNVSGYYFVQTGATTYDMVSAADGKSWITWEF
jgi:hypothetical protein